MAGTITTRRKGKGLVASAGSSPPPPSKRRRGNKILVSGYSGGEAAEAGANQQPQEADFAGDTSPQGPKADKDFRVSANEHNLLLSSADFPAIPSLANIKQPGDFSQLRSLMNSKLRSLREAHIDKAYEKAEKSFSVMIAEVSSMAQEDCNRLNKNMQAAKEMMATLQEKHQKAVESLDAEVVKWTEELQKVDGKEVAKKFRKNFTFQIENMKKDVASTSALT